MKPEDSRTELTADEPSETEQLRVEIEATREELGDTVEALAHKADVKEQVSEKVTEKKREAKAKVEDLGSKVGEAQAKVAQAPPVQQARERPWIPIAGAAVVGLLLIVLLKRRGR
jgi:ElaB/YqjD/DUF883 family membrane-anchored ribosome-binding protein